jgi:hypothetical protein
MTIRPFKKRYQSEIPISLAEAALLRDDCHRHIKALQARLLRNVTVQEGDTPLEDPQTLLAELDANLEKLEELTHRIHLTHAQTLIEDGLTLLDAIGLRDILILKISIYQSLVDRASERPIRDRASQPRTLSTINIIFLNHQIEQLEREYRSLDTKIQQTNWLTELLY